MSAPSRELPRKILVLAIDLVGAASDGRITSHEAIEILAEAGEVLEDAIALGDLVAFVGDLIQRDPAELEARAAKLVEKGKIDRAEKLRAKAKLRAE